MPNASNDWGRSLVLVKKEKIVAAGPNTATSPGGTAMSFLTTNADLLSPLCVIWPRADVRENAVFISDFGKSAFFLKKFFPPIATGVTIKVSDVGGKRAVRSFHGVWSIVPFQLWREES
jgi:hypothetical protein